uniref:Uncharacterized protein n=1 Tax=Tetranychus urticae TaxID=32264 RepID=T1JV61_TETUR
MRLNGYLIRTFASATAFKDQVLMFINLLPWSVSQEDDDNSVDVDSSADDDEGEADTVDVGDEDDETSDDDEGELTDEEDEEPTIFMSTSQLIALIQTITRLVEENCGSDTKYDPFQDPDVNKYWQ